MSQSVTNQVLFTSRHQAVLFLLGSVLLWGFAPVGNRYFLGSGDLAMPGTTYMALRFTISSLCFLPSVIMAAKTWSLRDWTRGGLCGLAGVTGYNLLAGVAGRTVSAGMTGLINSSESLMILIMACLLARRWPDRRTVCAAIFGAVGIVVLALSAGPAEGSLYGIMLLLLGAVGWAFYCVFMPPLIAKHGVLQSSAVSMFVGTVPLLACGWRGIMPMAYEMNLHDWEILMALAIGSSVLALLAWNKGVAMLGAQTSGWFLYLMPVFAALGGWVMLGEHLTIMEFIGGLMILGSVYIAQRR